MQLAATVLVDTDYHRPGKGSVVLAAGTVVEVVPTTQYTTEQLRVLSHQHPPGAVIMWDGEWTTISRDRLRFDAPADAPASGPSRPGAPVRPPVRRPRSTT